VTAPENFVPFMPQGAATLESVAATLDGALSLLGPNGENWTQGRLTQSRGAGLGFAYCVVGALERAAPDYESYAAARDTLKAAAGVSHLDRWNNGTTFSSVQLALDVARAALTPR